jgi:hypothetical protein
MPHRNEQPTLFELSPGAGFEPVGGLGFKPGLAKCDPGIGPVDFRG